MPHTLAKHAILRHYLLAWLPIMGRYNTRIIYLDGFAGPGVYTGGEPGSPIIALQAAIEQRDYLKHEVIFLFVEEDKARLESLESALSALAIPRNFKVKSRLGDCRTIVTQLLDVLDRGRNQLAPTFAFLDPFGFSDTPLSLIARLVRSKGCEVMITFMFEEINRFLGHEDLPTHFDGLFGTTEWRRALAIGTGRERRAFLKQLYQQQLSSAAGIRHVLAFEMRNKADSLDYLLFFGTNSLKGLAKMKEAMWKVDASTGFTFSDATDPSQEVIFGGEPDRADIRRRLVHAFSGRSVTVEQVENFILESTPYCKTHFRSVLKELERDGAKVSVLAAKPGRKRGTFPPGTLLAFASQQS